MLIIYNSILTQQTFVLMKTSWRRLEDVLRLCLQKTSWRRLHQDEYIRLTHTSSEDVLIKTNILVLVIRLQDVFKTFSRRLQDVLQKRLQDIFKTSSRRFQDVFKTSSRLIQDVLKTSSRRLQDVLQRSLQDVFKTYHQVKLFLLTRFQDVFEIYSKRFWDVLQRCLSIEGFA